ncbi:MAG: dihydrofolate reductase [Gammaproteobacteria bacterium]|nr:dihydrofolate reductase [Gammaproteobacteria bacterium]MCP5201423.1 dihydrofolate reductase [Gammaproteobacteria bacterium]
MRLSIVVARDRQGVIGRDGTLPWHLPDDLKRFRAITMGKPIVMGRRTHASIGRPLPGRRNIVLTRDADYAAPGCEVFAALDTALAALEAGSEAMIIGGAALYREALGRASRLYLTEVEAEVAGDVHFPAIDAAAWQEVSSEYHAADERHAHPFRFRVLERA